MISNSSEYSLSLFPESEEINNLRAYDLVAIFLDDTLESILHQIEICRQERYKVVATPSVDVALLLADILGSAAIFFLDMHMENTREFPFSGKYSGKEIVETANGLSVGLTFLNATTFDGTKPANLPYSVINTHYDFSKDDRLNYNVLKEKLPYLGKLDKSNNKKNIDELKESLKIHRNYFLNTKKLDILRNNFDAVVNMYSELSDDPRNDIPHIFGFTSENHTIEQIRGSIPSLNRDFEDRVDKLASIKDGIATLVSENNIAAQKRWLHAKQIEFSGKSAFDLISDETMEGIDTVNSAIIRMLG